MMLRALLVATLLACNGCTAMLAGGGAGTGSAGTTQDDGRLSALVRAKLSTDPATSGIGVYARGGWVTLTGAVASYAIKDRAGRIAGDTAGVAGVNNQLLVRAD